MADQVNPLGGLASGMGQALQVLQTLPAPSSTKFPLSNSTESQIQSATASALDQQDADVSEDRLDEAVKSVGEYLQQKSPDIAYKVDRESGRYYFNVINPETKETIRQVPAEEVLAMARRVREMNESHNQEAMGILVDQQG
jgi:flagellar protein FlaG